MIKNKYKLYIKDINNNKWIPLKKSTKIRGIKMPKLVYQIHGMINDELVYVDREVFTDYDECKEKAEKLHRDGLDGITDEDNQLIDYLVEPMVYNDKKGD